MIKLDCRGPRTTGKTVKQVIDRVLLPRPDAVSIITICPRHNESTTILKPGDRIRFTPCRFWNRISVKGTFLWTGMRFVKA